MFGYGYGNFDGRVLTEDDTFAPPGSGRFEEHLAAMRSRVLAATHVEGVALQRGVSGPAYNVADDEPVSFSEMMTAMATALRAPQPLVIPSWLLTATPYAKAMMTGGLRVSATGQAGAGMDALDAHLPRRRRRATSIARCPFPVAVSASSPAPLGG